MQELIHLYYRYTMKKDIELLKSVENHLLGRNLTEPQRNSLPMQ